jgi:16S rRNA (cytosine967-C5)-methyltransferase
MEGRGEILSCDIHPHKIKLIEQGARRLGLELIHAQVHDAVSEEQGWADAFDLVIADVPCSGLGVIRKKPDIRYKPVEPMARLPEIQKAILRTQAQYVKPGGVLLYSTCTILPRENQAVVEAFLRDHPAYSLQPFCLSGDLCAPDGMLTLYPHIHGTDGFFVAKLRRNP